jgi:hypothetical protein
MFIQNKYYNWYTAIIDIAKHRSKILDYTEIHHIIPKSLGGTDLENNLVELSAREHFICHFLLTKFTTGQNYHKMIYACQGMRRARGYQNRYINSRLYEIIKREGAKIQSERFLGKKLSNDHRAKISASSKGRIRSKETIEKTRLSNTGKKRTTEQIQNIKTGQLNAPKPSKEELQRRIALYAPKVSAALKGRSKSDDHKEKISKTLTGKMKGVAKSEETKQKMRKPKSEAHRKAISEARKAKYAAIKNKN